MYMVRITAGSQMLCVIESTIIKAAMANRQMLEEDQGDNNGFPKPVTISMTSLPSLDLLASLAIHAINKRVFLPVCSEHLCLLFLVSV